MEIDRSVFDWIDSQRGEMVRLLTKWCGINSYSYNVEGLRRMADALVEEFGELERIALAPAESIDSLGKVQKHEMGEMLRLVRHADAAVKVLLNIHYDTVYPAESKFREVSWADAKTLRGPGVLDAKGGILVMLMAVRALERSNISGRVGYEIVLNPDEEIGSPGSGDLIVEAGKRCDCALLFEPAFSDGWLIDQRKGSGNFVFVVRGRAAHAGREFQLGRSAIVAAAELVVEFCGSLKERGGVTINCGKIEGGGALNVVPDLAIARFNVRVTNGDEQWAVEAKVGELVERYSRKDGISVEVHGGFRSPPKVLDERSRKLLEGIVNCAAELGMKISSRISGGASDGNRLAAAGVAVVDSMGPVGAELHSEREWVDVDSLVQRAKLTAMVLMKIAIGEIRVHS